MAEFILSHKQGIALDFLQDDHTSEVFYGGGAGCFAAGTLVNTTNGFKPISEVKIGESVLSFNIAAGTFEYKKVIDTFAFNAHRQREKLCIFAFNGTELKCTDNHEFYFRGAWNTASIIRRREVEIRGRNGQQIPYFKQGQAINNRIQGRASVCYNEAGIGREWIPKNDDKTRSQRKVQHNQNAPDNSAALEGKSIELASCEPFGLCQDEQRGYQFGMVNNQQQRIAFIQRRQNQTANLHRSSIRLKSRNIEVDRATGNRNSSEIQTENLHTGNVREGIRGFTRYNQRCNTQELEACSATEIISDELVYDLCVEDNHNYCVTPLNIIAHNSGKSRLGCYWHIKRRLKYPKTRGVIGRAKLGTLLESTFVTFLKVCELLELKQNREFRYNQVKSKVFWANGSETILKDLFFYPSDPEFQSLGSTEYTDAFVDEAPEVTEKAIEILGSRLRYMLHDYGLKPKMLMTGNPGDHWIKRKYVKGVNGDYVNLKDYQQRVLATLSDNPDKEFVRLYMEQLGKLNEYDKQRLLHGDWDAIPRTGFEFYPQFNVSDHMRRESELQYIPDLPIHFSFDVNEHPYMTLELIQIQELEDRVQVRFFDEFCYPHPFNSIRAVSTAAVTRYGSHNAGAYVYGDYTSKRQDSDLGQMYKHKYDIAFEVLRPLLSTGYDRVLPNANPILRRDLMRGCLDRSLPIEILISEKCHQLKTDMIYLKEGPNGHKVKQKERNPVTLVTYEKWGHATDSAEYFLSTAFPHYLNRKRVA